MKFGSLLAGALLLLGVGGIFPKDCLAGNDAASAATTDASAAAPDANASSSDAVISSPASEPAAPTPQARRSGVSGFAWGIGIDASTLGIGAQFALEVLPRANVRAGFNWFDYRGTVTSDGILYTGDLKLKSANVNFDYDLFRKFRVSPGFLIYDGNYAVDNASVPGGDTFTFGNATYESSTSSPVHANARLELNKVAPEVLFGYGNLIPRNGRRRWSFEAEAGVAFQGAPKIAIGLTGFACTPPNSSGPSCVNAATDPSVQSNVRVQEMKLAGEATVFKFYPVVSVGISYSF